MACVCVNHFLYYRNTGQRNLHRQKPPVPSLVPFKRTVRSKPGKERKGRKKNIRTTWHDMTWHCPYQRTLWEMPFWNPIIVGIYGFFHPQDTVRSTPTCPLILFPRTELFSPRVKLFLHLPHHSYSCKLARVWSWLEKEAANLHLPGRLVAVFFHQLYPQNQPQLPTYIYTTWKGSMAIATPISLGGLHGPES